VEEIERQVRERVEPLLDHAARGSRVLEEGRS
jgi:hypothetical protein